MRPLYHILEAVYSQPWAILPAKHQAIQKVIEAHLTKKAFLDPSDIESDPAATEAPTFQVVGKTAIVPVAGVILNKCSSLESLCGAFSLETFKATLAEVAGRADVQNVILSISSSGGTVMGVPEAADAIGQLSKAKNVYAWSNDIIASAAYWLASQCSSGVFISKSANVGSIGVYLAVIDESKAWEQGGLKLDLIKAGNFKGMGLPGSTLSLDQRALLQTNVDKLYQEFTGYVMAKRPSVPAAAMQGQMFDATEAKANGLIDGIVSDLDKFVSYLNQ